jgi:hypothetical protein
MHTGRRAEHHADALAPRLVPVAVRARDGAPTPLLGEPGDVGQLVPDSRRNDHSRRPLDPPGVGDELEPAFDADDGCDARRLHDPIRRANLTSPIGHEVEWRVAIAAQHTVHVRSEPVARLTPVEHEHSPTSSSEDECRAQPRGATSDNDDVPVLSVHASTMRLAYAQ